jgi:protein-disulfide isomerase
LTVVEFVDYECPVCAAIEPVMAQLHREFPLKLRRVIHHFPIQAIHDQALSAAAAAECAASQSRFPEMHRVLLTERANLRKIEWTSLAKEAGIPDLERFARCRLSDSIRRTIDEAVGFAKGMGVTSTPTFVMNRRWMTGASGPQLRALMLAQLR